MPILVRNIRLELEEPEAQLLEALAKRLRVPQSAVRTYAAVRCSLDARKHDDLHFVYHLEVALDEDKWSEARCIKRIGAPNVVPIRPSRKDDPTPGTEPMKERPIIVGFGPAGMFAALRLVAYGHKPIILERGVDVRRRHHDVLKRYYRDRVFNPRSNLLFGEGGAGTYSDGKLYTRLSEPLVRTVLEWFYHHGADPSVLTDARPHIGSDRLPTICRHMREYIERCGGEVRFESHVDDLVIDDGKLSHIGVNERRIEVGPVILAIGHSARDTFRLLHERGVVMEPRPFQIGVRIEHPQTLVDRWQYGQAAGHARLGPAEYHVVAKGAAGGHGDCYSFCMCPGGIILPTNEEHNLIATNGASKAGRDAPFANSGLVVGVDRIGTAEDPLGGFAYQRKWERLAFEATGRTYRVPAQRAGDFLDRKPSNGALEISFPLGGQWCDIRELIPPEVTRALQTALPSIAKKMPGYAGSDGVITAPETRVSNPVRVLRDESLRTATNIDNLYPCGEGSGYAGGIVSAAIDGIKTADALIRCYAPPK